MKLRAHNNNSNNIIFEPDNPGFGRLREASGPFEPRWNSYPQKPCRCLSDVLAVTAAVRRLRVAPFVPTSGCSRVLSASGGGPAYLRLFDGGGLAVTHGTDVQTGGAFPVALKEELLHQAVHPLGVEVQGLRGVAEVRAVYHVLQNLQRQQQRQFASPDFASTLSVFSWATFAQSSQNLNQGNPDICAG